MANQMTRQSRCEMRVLATVLLVGLTSSAAIADVSLLGVQYQEDDPFTEYACFWNTGNYPTSCPSPVGQPGANLHVFFKNDGASAVTLDKAYLEGYDLGDVIKLKNFGTEEDPKLSYSIWYKWDNPPAAIFDAGEPAWFRMFPKSVPVGGVGQLIVRLRRIPTTTPLDVAVDTSANTFYTNITVDTNAPQLANISFSQDLKTVYMYWRRANGTAPTTIKMDGTDITSSCETGSDANLDMAVTVYTRSTALTEFSYHVFQGIYADAKTATGFIRVWKNPFIYGSWGMFNFADAELAYDWIDTCYDRGINTQEMQGGWFSLVSQRSYAEAHNYQFINEDNSWGTPNSNPRLWFIGEDEPDIEEWNFVNNFCGDAIKMPCDTMQAGHKIPIYLDQADSLENIRARLKTVNMDGAWIPYSWYAWGQMSDVLCIGSYYEKRVMYANYYDNDLLPLYDKPTVNYAVARVGARAAEPNPSRMLLFSCQANPDGFDPWPWADPESKRMEVYHVLAGGCKGINYWWFKDGLPSDGLDAPGDENLNAEDPPLWKEIGLLGAEIKTLQPYLVTSYPINVEITPSTNVWAKALGQGTNTLIMFVANDNYYIDEDFHGTDTTNATVTVTLPDWMQYPTPTAFEVSRRGLENVTTNLNGEELELSIGTISVARMFIITTDPNLRMTIQNRYDQDVWQGICNFAPDSGYAITTSPSILVHPSSKSVVLGGSATLTVTATGGSPLSFQWRKNGVNLSDGGHYSGCNTYALTVSSFDSGDEANYSCVVSNPYGSTTSNAATLSITTVDITQQPITHGVCAGSATQFSVTATGQGTLSYQWQKNQINLSNGGHYSGVTASTLTISNADSNDAANYRCLVTDDTSSLYSDEALLIINTGASITQQPSNQLIETGETAVFSVDATGTGSLTYQWQKNQANLSNGGHYSGVYTDTLTVSNVDSNDEADYRCVVTDDCGVAYSDTASLVLNICGSDIVVPNGDFEGGFSGGVGIGWTSYTVGGATPTYVEGGGNPIPGQRMDYTKTRETRYYGMRQAIDANVGDAFTFTADVWCLENSNNANCSLRVSWSGGTAITGATQVCNADQPNSTWTQLGFGAGNATAASVTLFADVRAFSDSNKDTDTSWDNIVAYRAHVPPAPAVSSASSTSLDVNVNPGCNLSNTSAEFAITIGGGGYTLGTHWVQPGGTVSTSQAWQTDSAWGVREVPGLSTGVIYTFKVKARYNNFWTTETYLGVGATGEPGSGGVTPPTITQHPSPQNVDTGSSAQFTVSATGDAPLSYQWQKNQINLSNGGHYSGVTTTTLTITDADSGDQANYRCVVTNAGGSAYSNEAALTVNAPPNPGDFDDDGDVDMVDFGTLQKCLSATEVPAGCEDTNLNGDTTVDADDLAIFLQCLSGADIPSDPNCTN